MSTSIESCREAGALCLFGRIVLLLHAKFDNSLDLWAESSLTDSIVMYCEAHHDVVDHFVFDGISCDCWGLKAPYVVLSLKISSFEEYAGVK